MAVLIDNVGRICVDSINNFLNPVLVGRFIVSNAGKEFIKNKLTSDNINLLFQYLPPDMEKFCSDKKLIKTKASMFKKSAQDSDQKRSDASEKPHINEGNEVHFIFAGGYIFCFNINDQHYSLVVQEGDWIYIASGVEHWIKPTEDGYLLIASYHSEPFDTFHKKVKYTDLEDRAFI